MHQGGTFLDSDLVGPPRGVETPAAETLTADPVMSALIESGLEATALHNHFYRDEPRMFYMRVPWAALVGTNDNAATAGDVAMLASEVQPVLKALRHNGIDTSRSIST